jgi:hypothetical protein
MLTQLLKRAIAFEGILPGEEFPISSMIRFIDAESRLSICHPAKASQGKKLKSRTGTNSISTPRSMPGYSRAAQSPQSQQWPQPKVLSPFTSPRDCRVSWGPTSKLASNRVPGSEMKGYLKSQETSMPDPLTRPSANRERSRPTPVSSHSHSRDVQYSASLPQVPANVDPRQPSSKPTNRATSNDRKVNDKDVYRGLHVATAAACDEDVDKWIEEVMGYRVRRFLADLSAFDGLGVNALATTASRTAEQRKSQVHTWETAQAQRLMKPLERFDGNGEDIQIAENRTGESMDRKVRGVLKKTEGREGTAQLDGLHDVKTYLLER